MGRNILVVEDDRNICDLIHMYLVKEGFDVRIAGDGGKAIEEFQKQVPDLILLDIMLPVMDGWAVCAKIRETSKVPIIMLTAKGEVFDRIQGLEMGADDYVVKPFEMKELIARINAVLRRTEIPNDTSKRLTFDKLVIDLDSYELIVDGKKIDTPPKELELLYHLASTPNRVYTRDQLLLGGFPGPAPGAPRQRRQAARRVLGTDGIHFRQACLKRGPRGPAVPGETATSGR